MNISDKLTIIAENQQKIYDKGFADGSSASEKVSWDEVWDVLQNNGEYAMQFYRTPTWTDENFKPKYTVYASTATFTDGVDSKNGVRCGMTDLRKETIGVDVDWSHCTNFNNAFIFTPIKYCGIIDMSNATYGSNLFYHANALESVEKLILPTRAISFSSGIGFGAENLKDIQFEGTFKASVSFIYAINLSKQSIINIISALSDTTANLAVTFKTSTINKLFETSDGANDGSSSTEWGSLINSKSNWTVSLA